ncbi:MAG: cupin domain-containing protein [Phycisphaerales bacterium]|nr:MAG: cupin domain-containing protein [Phycisphaerales bacterium]
MHASKANTHSTVSLSQVKAYILADDGIFPNNERLPLLVYHGVLGTPALDLVARARELFHQNHWGESWINGIYDFHHYHSTAHEVLAIAAGEAKVQFGGKRGVIATVEAGDAVVIPAGVAHKNLGSGYDFTVVGAYPKGQHYDMCYGQEGERPAADQNIASVPLPQADPFGGPTGPLMHHWTA